MKAFDDINPQKILRELTDEPAEQINKVTGAAKTPAKTPAKPAAKPATKPATPAKPAAAKPTTNASTSTSARTSANTGAAKTSSGLTSTKNITPPPPKKATQSDGAAQPEVEDSAHAAPEPSILPPAEATANPEPPVADVRADPATQNQVAHDPDAGGAEEKVVMDATPRPTLTVNGKSTAAEGDA
jgi:hypothetical protein